MIEKKHLHSFSEKRRVQVLFYAIDTNESSVL